MTELYLVDTTPELYDEYFMVRSSPSDVYWNGYTSPPDKSEFRNIYLNRLSSSRFECPEDRRNYLIRVSNNMDIYATVGFIQLIKRVDGIDIGYSVIENYQRHGYATRALKLGIKIAKQFDSSVYVQIRDDNIASQKVATKCGFVRTEEYFTREYPEAGKIKLRKYILDY